ncbi:SDR family oxidoreductase [Bradyrhizobium sp. JYMT SZCCT0428]|uniref:SDR family oxidoreductase n=1 Tax=Bradyrhizobium sp. JYMT SZCCT0428 TaxID=2807673 RepID=UPI001BA442C6|nr:SDR family oxidoreductase [Bradyrhizobium sp. JYMT SZCCT0428]MBR1156673.1 SDR family oxidoreductase [Bradyrhizobium sp. JYMT SZCCT0428]
MGIVVITGTSTGIGFATAATLARGGHTVFAGMRNPDRGDELRELASKERLSIRIVRLDVDNDDSVDEAFKNILKENGHIDVLVNNAGISGGGPVELVPIGIFRQIMETNFFGAIRCIKAVVPSMRERRSGCIVNITSVAGQFGMSPQGPYAASKWALEGLSECLAQELSAFNVRVAMVEPGVIATPMTTSPRPMPPPTNPYFPIIRRMVAYFTASLKTPSSPFEVAETIQGIVDGKSTKLRNPTGHDGAKLIQWRKSKTDEEWVKLGAASDSEWAADAQKNLGVDVNSP